MSGLNKSIIEKWFIGHVGTLYFLFGVCEKYKLSEIIITISSYCCGDIYFNNLFYNLYVKRVCLLLLGHIGCHGLGVC